MIHIIDHARERMEERLVSDEEVTFTVESGEQFPAKYGRVGFRCNFKFEAEWNGKFFSTKQLEVYAEQEEMDWIVISLITKFF